MEDNLSPRETMRSAFREALATPGETVLPVVENPITAPETPAELAAPVETAPETQAAPPVADEFSLDLDADPLAVAPQGVDETLPVADSEEDQDIENLKKFAKDSGTSEERFRRIYQAHKTLQELQKAPEEGGIGFRPELSQIRDAFDSHTLFEKMKTDFEGQDGAAPFANFWFGADRNGRPLPGSVEIAQELPNQLARLNPAALRAMATPIVGMLQDRILELAQSGRYSEEDQARLNDAVKVIETAVGSAPRTSPGAAPAQESDELARLRRENEQLRGRARQQTETSVLGQVDDHIFRVVDADVEKALSPLKQHYANSPRLYEAAKAAIRGEILQGMKGNRTVMTHVENAKTRMSRRGSLDELPQLTRMVRQAYEGNLHKHRATYLKEAGVNMAAQASQMRTQLEQSSQRTAPASNGVAPNNTNSPLAQKQGETNAEYRRRGFREALAVRR